MSGRRISLPLTRASFFGVLLGLTARANRLRVTGSSIYVKKD